MRYKTDLGNYYEKKIKIPPMLIYIIVVTLILTAVIVLPKMNDNKKGKKLKQQVNTYFRDSSNFEKVKNKSKITENIEEKFSVPKKEEAKEKTIKIKKKEKKSSGKNKPVMPQFVNSVNGYEITEITMKKNKEFKVSLKKGISQKTLGTGDKIGKYQITEIHRTYILLKYGSKIIHLNNLN
ncbi:MAG: hypothetical protein CSB55_06365 [Candidatus Cloacimonadota bacterium]|nr:MAG: hypothetical protein CSB55_06365 [Candidatus Cloacimonadota bacterium]